MITTIIDTHCHYNLEPLYSGQISADFPLKNQQTKTWQDHWQKAQQNGVAAAINVGSSLSSSLRAIELADQENNFFTAIAVHPLKYASLIKTYLKTKQSVSLVNEEINQHLIQLTTWLKTNNPKIVAIGETGLDYFNLPDKGDKREWIIKAQAKAFNEHLKLAKKFNLPSIIHVRDKPGKTQAYFDTINILKKHLNQAFILHCISGPIEYVKQALELGAFIGIAGNITYPQANQVREAVAICPKERLLIETDAPYLAPGKFKGKVCEPWMICETAKFLKTEFQLDRQQLFLNSTKIFKTLGTIIEI